MIEKVDYLPIGGMNFQMSTEKKLTSKLNEIIDQVNLITKSLEGRQFYEQEKK